MNIKEIIEENKIETIEVIKEDIRTSYLSKEDLNEEYIFQLNEEIELITWKFIEHNIFFNLKNENGEYYQSMLGKGKNIFFTDLYEILKRLYHYHHESQIFTIEFEDYKIEINYSIWEENKSYARMILDTIGNDWKLNTSDFN